MGVTYIHEGGGCEAISHQVGNELNDWEVHVYKCEKLFTHAVQLKSGPKLVCEEHAKKWAEMWKVPYLPLDVRLEALG